MKLTSVGLIALAALVFPNTAFAEDFPTKSVKIVVPFPPGGANNTVARFLADHLSARWEKAVVVENIPGGGSSIGTGNVAKADADGHTMLFVSASYATNAAVRTDLAYDPVNDLIPVAFAGVGEMVVVAGPSLEAGSLADLAELAKTRTVFYGAAGGVGSNNHLNGALVASALGVDMEVVAYQGGADANIDLLAGRLDLVVRSLEGLEGLVEKGAVPLAVLSDARTPNWPDVPTTTEAGFPDAKSDQYWAVYVPSETPSEIVSQIHSEIADVMHTPEAVALLESLRARPSDLSVEEARAKVNESIVMWTKLADQIGIR